MAIRPTEELLDDITKHALELQRLSNNTTDRFVKSRYQKLAKEMTALVSKNPFVGLGTPKSQKKRIKRILTESSKTIASVHADLLAGVQDTLLEVGQLETDFSQRSINRAATGKGSILIASNAISTRKISTTASRLITQGMPQREVWKRQSRRVREAFKDIIRSAYTNSEDLATTIGRIRGTKARNFRDGIMHKSYNQASTLARTSILGMSNAIRQETYGANRDVLNGVQFLAHLDSRTTEICMAHSGDEWFYDREGNLNASASGHDPVTPPLHFNCRSTLVPIVKTAAELPPVKKERIPLSRRKHLGESVPKNKYTSADEWLKTQPVEYQKDVLGKAHALWANGRVSFQRFVNQKGRLRTPQELSELYMRKELVPDSIEALKTSEKFKPYSGAQPAFKAELATVEKGEFLKLEERLMTGKTVSRKESDLVGRIIVNADPADLELAKDFSPVDFETLAGNKGKRLAMYNHVTSRFSRFKSLAKGDLAKRKTGALSEIDKLVKQELVAKITADEAISRGAKSVLLDMLEEAGPIVGTQRTLPMVESLFTLARKADFSDIKGSFLGYWQRSTEKAVNSYFARAKRLEVRLGQGVEKDLRYGVISNAAKKAYFAEIKSKGRGLAEVSKIRTRTTRIGTRKLRSYEGSTATAESVNMEFRPDVTITNYLANIHEARMSDRQIKAWAARMHGKKQQIIVSRTIPGSDVLVSDKFLKLKEFEKWNDNAWSGRGFPSDIRKEVGEVLGDVQIHNDLVNYLKGKVIAPRAVVEAGISAEEHLVSSLAKFLDKPSKLKLVLYRTEAEIKLRRLYKLSGAHRKILREAREKAAERRLQDEGFFSRLLRKEDKLSTAEKAERARKAAAANWESEADAVFIRKTEEGIEKGIQENVLNRKLGLYNETKLVMDQDIIEVSRLVNQEAFRTINAGGGYLDAVKNLGDKFYFKFKGVLSVDEDDAVKMGHFLMQGLERAKIVEKFKSVTLVKEAEWMAPKEQVMWMIRAKNKTWEEAILANRRNYEFDGLPSLSKPVFDERGLLPNGQAAIRSTKREDVAELLSNGKAQKAIDNLNHEAATGIRINGYVYDVQSEMERRGVGIGTAIPRAASSKVDQVAYSTRGSWVRTRKVAKSMRDETFYNGMSNDRYARTYSNTTALHWQGDHVSRGLMEFSKGVKMGKHGEAAFKQEFINVALDGFDKLPIKVRIQVYDMIPDKLIKDTIADPIKHDWWHTKTNWFEAGILKDELKGIPKEWAKEIRRLAIEGESDGAWNFLSLLKERSNHIDWKTRGKRLENYVSHKQLQVDGTTNVLQHLAGISKDVGMASKVNMVTADRVADAYIAVRDQLEVLGKAMDIADPRKKYVEVVLTHAKRRKSVKKGLMTYQYNAGPATLGESYFQALEGVLVEGKPIFQTASASDKLAIGRLIAKASDDIFPNSHRVKKLLNNLAEAHQISGKETIEFASEIGFPFRQQYKMKGVRQISLPDLNGRSMRLNLMVDLDEMDWAKQNRAFAPNIIHMMDATHKSMVVNKLAKKGVTNFSMIHDSFGSSAGHMKALNLATRETFKELYEKRTFVEELYKSFKRQGVTMKRFVRNDSGQKVKYTQTTKLTGNQERFSQDGRVWVVEPIPMAEVRAQGAFDFKDFNELEYFFH